MDNNAKIIFKIPYGINRNNTLISKEVLEKINWEQLPIYIDCGESENVKLSEVIGWTDAKQKIIWDDKNNIAEITLLGRLSNVNINTYFNEQTELIVSGISLNG